LIRVSLLVLALVLLAVEIVNVLPQALAVWHPYDYGLYIEMGNAVRQGLNPIGPRHYYPLPTALWVFAPLSLMPDWFRIVWALVPSIFILVLFRRQGV
jgi:hypothetical protein